MHLNAIGLWIINGSALLSLSPIKILTNLDKKKNKVIIHITHIL